jgi:hypothetical protein
MVLHSNPINEMKTKNKAKKRKRPQKTANKNSNNKKIAKDQDLLRYFFYKAALDSKLGKALTQAWLA